MNQKSTGIALKSILGGIFFASVLAVGCNSGSEEKKEAAPAETTTTPTPPTDSSAQKMDTAAATKPVVTPN